jgi:hypothetical protein
LTNPSGCGTETGAGSGEEARIGNIEGLAKASSSHRPKQLSAGIALIKDWTIAIRHATELIALPEFGEERRVVNGRTPPLMGGGH